MGRRAEKTGKSEVVISLSPSIPVLTCVQMLMMGIGMWKAITSMTLCLIRQLAL